MVTGRDEKPLGETVGEIVHGGGKARHVAGEGRASSVLGAAVLRAKEVFGALDIVIDTELTDVEYTFEATVPHLRSPGRLLFVVEAPSPEISQGAKAIAIRARARPLPRGVTCNAIVVENLAPDTDADDVAADVGELAVYLCTRAADRITGQSIALEAGA